MRHISTNISLETDRILNRFKKDGQSYTDTISHALNLYAYIIEVEKDGSRIFIKDPQGKLMELHII